MGRRVIRPKVKDMETDIREFCKGPRCNRCIACAECARYCDCENCNRITRNSNIIGCANCGVRMYWAGNPNPMICTGCTTVQADWRLAQCTVCLELTYCTGRVPHCNDCLEKGGIGYCAGCAEIAFVTGPEPYCEICANKRRKSAPETH